MPPWLLPSILLLKPGEGERTVCIQHIREGSDLRCQLKFRSGHLIPFLREQGVLILIRYVLAWFLLLVIAFANGALRQITFGKAMSELHAHQLSTLIGSVLIGVAVWFIIRTWPPSSSRQAVTIGVTWLSLTILFEFFMGLAVAGRPLLQVLHDYNVLAGRVWVLFLIWITVAPWLFYRLQRKA